MENNNEFTLSNFKDMVNQLNELRKPNDNILSPTFPPLSKEIIELLKPKNMEQPTPPPTQEIGLNERIEDIINEVTYDEITVKSAVELIEQEVLKVKLELLKDILAELKTENTTIEYMVESTEYEIKHFENQLKQL